MSANADFGGTTGLVGEGVSISSADEMSSRS
jgi:hypothetical protein